MMTYLASLPELTIELDKIGRYWLALNSLLAENDYRLYLEPVLAFRMAITPQRPGSPIIYNKDDDIRFPGAHLVVP